MIISCLLGVPISYVFWYCTKIGYEGFGALWPVRFMGFATSMITFPLLTYFYLGETIGLKTAVTILLSVAIMILQLIWSRSRSRSAAADLRSIKIKDQ